ncbi:MAG: bifunctional isocitrate dehydrogenase kinase/phosphatase [Bacteroidota bacterium]
MPLTAATTIRDAYDAYLAGFRAVTRRAKRRFEARDWAGAKADTQERLGLYRPAVDAATLEVRQHLGTRAKEREVWAAMKRSYADLVRGRQDIEIAETFYNSVVRRVFSTVGVDPSSEFVGSRYERFCDAPLRSIYRTFTPASQGPDGYARLVERIAEHAGFDANWADLPADAALAGARLEHHVAQVYPGQGIESVQVFVAAFYRNKGAYLVGRLRTTDLDVTPFALAVVHPEAGLCLDAVLLTPDEASQLFSYTRSYFMVDVPRPWEVVAFLKTILPHKWEATFYTCCGFDKHGKTVLYRHILSHLASSNDQFVPAPGVEGMVMDVFTLPSFDLVFKVIRDRFAPPKQVTRQDVLNRYRYVFLTDRVGRLMDTQEFEHITFERERFAEDTLDELLGTCGSTVHVDGAEVVIRHVYTERRVTPLNLYLTDPETTEAQRELAVIDFGRCIKDLAAADIFPGDMFGKNFGVTRLGRVVFYDYDEMEPLSSQRFAELPVQDDPYASEYSHYVDPDVVYPAEFKRYLGLPEHLLRVFLEHHGELFTVRFWNGAKRRLREHVWPDFFPYPESVRLRRAEALTSSPSSQD